MKALLLAGAAAMTFTTSASAATAPAPKPKTIVVTGSDCLITGKPQPVGQQNFLGAVLAILGPILVEMAIDGVTADLKKIRTVKSEGSLDFDLWKRSDDKKGLVLNVPPCFTVITGEFEEARSQQLEDPVVATTLIGPNASEETLKKRLADNGIVAKEIYHILEAKVVSSEDHTAFKYEPLYFRSVELMPGNGAKKQGLVYNITLRGPGASPWGSVYSLAPISFGEVGAGTELHPTPDAEKLKRLTTGSLVMPGMSETAYMAYFQDWKTGSIASFMPANLQAEVVQTKKPSDAALFLAGVLEKAKPKITEKVGAALNPDAAFTATQAKLDAEIALAEADKALADLRAAAAPDAAAIKIAELKAKKAKEKFDNLP